MVKQRTRQQIEADGTRVDVLQLELLLDIRDILQRKKSRKPVGRPKKRVSK